jgi:dipeptidyl aminopeptidase/acylaminoacyl peptidase
MVRGVAFSPDGGLLASIGVDQVLRLRDPATGKEVRSFAGPPGAGSEALGFSPDGKILATNGLEKNGQTPAVFLYDVATGKEVRRMVPRGGKSIHALAFSPTGTLLASAGDEAVRVWDVATGKERLLLRGHQDAVRAVAFAPDGATLASGSRDRTVRLWDPATGKELRRIEGHRGSVAAVAFSPDGKLLASGASDTTMLVWDLTDGKAARPQRVGPPAKDPTALWAALASSDARAADRAAWVLTADPVGASALLRERLQPVRAPDPRRLAQLLTDLDSERFAVREQAAQELERYEGAVKPALARVLEGKPSTEVRRRVEQLLAKLDNPVPSPEVLRALRAVGVLEWIGTAEARRVLERATQGAAEARQTREAKAALERLTGRR